MTKKKISIGKVVNQLREQNKSNLDELNKRLSDAEKNISDLETLALVIIEKLKRTEKYPVVMTKKGKLLPPKIVKDKSLIPANDSVMEQNNSESVNTLLRKIYNFMVKNSEKEKQKKELQENIEKENKKERQLKYERLIKQRENYEKKKEQSKGSFSSVGGFIKTGIIGSIGLAIGGLVWLFKDEIKTLGKNLIDNLKSLSDTLSKGFNFLSSVFSAIKNVVDSFANSELFKTLSDNTKTLFDSVNQSYESTVNTVLGIVNSAVSSVYDTMTKWITSSIKPLADFLQNSTDISIKGLLQKLSEMVLAFAAGPVGEVAVAGKYIRKTITGARNIVDEIEENRLRSIYGDKYYEKTKKVMEMYDDKQLEALYGQQYGGRFKDYFLPTGDLNKTQLLNAIVREHLEGQLTVKPKGFPDQQRLVEKRRSAVKLLQQRDEEFVSDLQNSIDQLYPNKNYKVESDGESFKVIDPSTRGVILDLDTSDFIELLRLKGKKAFLDYFNEKVKSGALLLSEKKDEFMMKNAGAFENVKSSYEQLSESASKLQESSSKSYSSAASLSKQITSSVVQNYSGVSSAEEFGVKTISPMVELVRSGLGGAGMLAEKASEYDWSSFINKSLEIGKESGQKLFSFLGQINDPVQIGKMEGMIQNAKGQLENLITPEPVRTPEITQDPNEDPLMLSDIWKQSQQSVIGNQVKSINTGSTSPIDDTSNICVRNQNLPFRVFSSSIMCRP